MANVLVLLSDLHSGRSSSAVEVGLLRFWEARNVRRSGELMGVDMLLLDSQILHHFRSTFFSEKSAMANVLVLLSDLHSGRSSSAVEVRLLRFWEARNVRRSGELMGVDMLLLDSQSTMMPATVNVNRLATHLTNLEEGSVYSLTGFEVTHCNQNYRLSDSSLLIRFTDSTSFKKVTEPAVPIPLESFRFRNYSEMLGLANSNNQLPDLIGEITAVKSTVTDPPQDKNRVMATIRMDNDTSVTMSLFDAQAVKIHNQLEQIGVDPRVVVATSVNPKIVGGRLFLNATSGTHIYFDKQTDAGERLFYRLVERDTGLPPVAPLLKSYAKVEKLSISELNDFVVTATYRVEMSIADETGEGLFVAFDGVIAKLHNMRAHEAANLLAGDDVNPEETDAPPFVRDMEGKSYTFQVKVGPYNFTANHQSFTISRILGEGERAPQPEFVEDGGDDDNGDDNDGAGLVRRKMKDGGCSKSAGPSAKSKKARKA
ncbi:hypothetical protein HID58_047287 [Brassica napus]|uniref:Replication protein A 70 kDa DNA-binding subunit B/D first OB fold domain-containing protein n=2 Tax=Brassica napus TaxID=3708 RepID=A0ABQ8AZ10_BRANA|nr:hypothetical protein HID58_047287 [Brassica napus]